MGHQASFLGAYPPFQCVNGVLGGGDFCHSNFDSEQMFTVPLPCGGPFAPPALIILYPRGDCCLGRLSGTFLDVRWGSDPPAWGMTLPAILTGGAKFFTLSTFSLRLRSPSAPGSALGFADLAAFSFGATTPAAIQGDTAAALASAANRALGGSCRASSFAPGGTSACAVGSDGSVSTFYALNASVGGAGSGRSLA